MDIVACTDNHFVMQTGIMMQSVCINNLGVSITFHIISDESLETKDKEDLKSVISKFSDKHILFYNIDGASFNNMPALGVITTITKATYYRFELTTILSESINKVLYLDGDIIVRHSLEPLWNTDIDNYAVAAVPDYNEAVIEKENYLQINPLCGYFNAGVMLINLKYWRDHHLREQFYEYTKDNFDRIVYRDQDVLNYVLNEKKLMLDIKFNLGGGWLYVIPGYDTYKYAKQLEEARKDPVIVHYTTSKPWYVYNRHPHPYRTLFFKYRNQTKWKDEPLLDDRPIMRRVIKCIATTMRKWGVLPELPPNGHEYIDIEPID